MSLTPSAPDRDPARWRILALVSSAVLGGMSIWLTGSAVAPELQAAWGLTRTEVGWLTTLVQLGFVFGTATAALLNLADVTPLRWYFTVSGVLGGLANAAVLVVPGYRSALVFRFLTGFFLAGVYPPAMKMIATWFRSARGMAIGTVVGALTVGKATPYLLKLFGGSSLLPVVGGASSAAIAGSLIVLVAYRDGPYVFRRAPFSWALVLRVVADRPTRLATGGYLGHMWELYAMWTWVPAFIMASAEALRETGGSVPSTAVLELISFGAIAAGGIGSVWGGLAADRLGRERLVNVAMAVSGLCCLGVGVLYGRSVWALAALVLVWGFFVVADSAQFSALVTEVAPQEAVGTALTLQTSVGFLLTMVTIQGVPMLSERFGWAWAFPMLALGPAAGIASIRRLSAMSGRQRA